MLLVIGAALAAPALPVLADQRDPVLDDLFLELKKTGDSDQAKLLANEIFHVWAAYEQGGDANHLMQVGMVLMYGQQVSSAERIFSNLIRDYPDFAEAWNQRAIARYIMGNNEGSKTDIAKVIDLEPRHFGALSGLGMIHVRNGDLQEAVQAFEAALYFNPHLNQAQSMIKMLNAVLGGRAL